jgi:3-oxoadipate enol-lactonase
MLFIIREVLPVFIKINNVQLNYEEKGSGMPLVFIHGLGECMQSWDHQVTFFCRRYRIINLDLRAHGQSSNDDAEIITIALLAKDIIELLHKLGIEKAVFIGHSMGGLICQEIALHYPESAIAFVLSDAAGFYPPPFSTVGLRERLAYLKTADMEDLAEMVAEKCCAPQTSREVRQEIKELFLHNKPESYKQATIATFEADYRAYHKQMNFPFLLLVGEYDQTTPPAYAEYLKKALPKAQLAVIPEAAHMSKVENPQEYNRLLSQFLEQLPDVL